MESPDIYPDLVGRSEVSPLLGGDLEGRDLEGSQDFPRSNGVYGGRAGSGGGGSLPLYTREIAVEAQWFPGTPSAAQHIVLMTVSWFCCYTMKGKVKVVPGGSDGKELVYNAGDLGLISGSGRSPREGNGYPLLYSCLENSMDGRAWRATVHSVRARHNWATDTFTLYQCQFPVSLLHSSYTKCTPWGKMSKQYMGPLYYFLMSHKFAIT